MFQNEKVMQTKTCPHCNSSFEITDKDLEFYEKVSPIFSGKKYLIPSPTLCPDCRQQRRLSFRNERKLYKRKCDATGKDIISIYSPDKPYKVYEQSYWWSDNWDPMDYGRDFDFSRSFFEQFEELMKEVPKMSLSVEKQENSEYSNYAGWNKDCYLIFLGANNQNCYYCNGIWDSKNTIDSSFGRNNQNCYGLVNSNSNFNCFNLLNSNNCNNSYESKNLESCEFCLFCDNLKNKRFFVLNKEVSKDEFENILSKYKSDLGFKKILIDKYSKLILPQKSNQNLFSENVIGNYIKNSQNIYYGFDLDNVKDSKYVGWLFDSKNCYDVYDWGNTAENCYECHKVGNQVSNTYFSAFCLSNISNLLYCYDVVNNSSNCFGCVGLNNKQYCILNKQYTKEEYETLVPKIIEHMQKTGEWGEFFPSSISPFGYNETVAMEYFPITPPSIPPLSGEGSNMFQFSLSPVRGKMSKGQIGVLNRSTYEPPFPKVDKIIKASMLPENISDIPDDILNWAIECEVSAKPFRIVKAELEFYRKHNLPIPKRHPDQRHLDRLALKNPRKLFERKCDKCGKDIKTTYSPDRNEIVYCEECYKKEVY
ncbi:MAG: hypothetical protein PHI37_03990 [Candidatus Gracilibacteria bacterium]|nr:hypothetical protein [Candidatus Gracilibacteria bacterium]